MKSSELAAWLSENGVRTVRTEGVSIDGGVRFDFAGGSVASLAPGEIVVVVNNLNALQTRYDVAGLLEDGLPIPPPTAIGEIVEVSWFDGPMQAPVLGVPPWFHTHCRPPGG